MKKFLLTLTLIMCLMLGIGVISASAEAYKWEVDLDNVTFSQEPESFNPGKDCFDGVASNYWASQGKAHLIMDLGSNLNVGSVGVQIYNFMWDDRTIPYSIYISDDGTNWRLMYTGESLVLSNDFIYTNLNCITRYLKFEFEGDNVSGWNRVGEIEVYIGESTIPDTEGRKPKVGKTTLIFTPEDATKGDIIAVVTVKDGVSSSYAQIYSGTGDVTFVIEAGFDSMKILVWDSYQSMEPLMEYVTIE